MENGSGYSAATSWLLGAAVGVLIILGSVLGWLGMMAAALLLVPLGRRGHGISALTGALTSFGSVWLILTWGALSSGGQYQDLTLVIVIGIVPLLVGLAWTAILAINARRHNEPI